MIGLKRIQIHSKESIIFRHDKDIAYELKSDWITRISIVLDANSKVPELVSADRLVEILVTSRYRGHGTPWRIPLTCLFKLHSIIVTLSLKGFFTSSKLK